MEQAVVYDVHHWECPYCGMGFEDEADLPNEFTCENCGQPFELI